MTEQGPEILRAVGRRLDETRALLDAAMERSAALERSLHSHEYDISDLRWEAAKGLLTPSENGLTMRGIHQRAETLGEQILASRRAAF